ncbi:MAG: TlpA family protein disulfide reductase [Zoogloea sp.]|uniref:TlpA family protein disulfide reductase n=1 Tax=Zoogloea sp. TaxID=49181 RepID=UPI003F41A50D
MSTPLLAALLLVLPLGALAGGAGGFTPLDRQQAAALMQPAQYREPTLIALWSSECAYCQQNLQVLARLQRQHPEVRIITLAVEAPGPELTRLYQRSGLRGVHYAYTDPVPESLNSAVDKNWGGELPRSYLFKQQEARGAVSGRLEVKAVEAAWGR